MVFARKYNESAADENGISGHIFFKLSDIGGSCEKKPVTRNFVRNNSPQHVLHLR